MSAAHIPQGDMCTMSIGTLRVIGVPLPTAEAPGSVPPSVRKLCSMWPECLPARLATCRTLYQCGATVPRRHRAFSNPFQGRGILVPLEVARPHAAHLRSTAPARHIVTC